MGGGGLGGGGLAWTMMSCRTNSASHSQERRPAGSVAEGPQPPPERGGGLGEAKSAAHSIPAAEPPWFAERRRRPGKRVIIL